MVEDAEAGDGGSIEGLWGMAISGGEGVCRDDECLLIRSVTPFMSSSAVGIPMLAPMAHKSIADISTFHCDIFVGGRSCNSGETLESCGVALSC